MRAVEVCHSGVGVGGMVEDLPLWRLEIDIEGEMVHVEALGQW